MKYQQWRDELFGQPSDASPVLTERSQDFFRVPSDEAFDFVDQMLVDSDIHSLFSKNQIGNAINTVYSNSCSDLPYLYTTACREDRRVRGIANLIHLYRNIFERYCTAPVADIGYDQADGPIGFISYMFWDVFVLYPENATPASLAAALSVMQSVLNSRNDNCLVSVIHGLGHWASDVPHARTMLERWLARPTTQNIKVLEYARVATSGMIQ